MYDAFLQLGYNVKLLSGQQNIGNKKRKENVAEINKWLDSNKPDLCYIESSTYPILNSWDRKLIKRIHRMGIKTGYFLRDAYYKFPNESYDRNSSLKARVKKAILKQMYLNDERLLSKYVDIVYFPTNTLSDYFSFKSTNTLPPAGSNRLITHNFENKTCIYVGGVSKLYGGELLLKSFHLLNAGDTQYKLILVCRENEVKKIDKELIKDVPWLEIHHVSGEKALAPLYERASAALLPRTPGKYADLSLSVKVFEYMSYGLPIVAMNAKEMGKLINKFDIGIVTENSAESFSKAIQKIFSDQKIYTNFNANIEKALLKSNLWQHRAEQIINDLTQ